MSAPATPRFRMPAEWEPHEATLLAWPHNETDWPGKFGPIHPLYADIVRLISQSERVIVLAPDEAAAADARALCASADAAMDAVEFLVRPTNRSWIRDFGPILVEDAVTAVPVALDWTFNAWAKYDDWQQDNEVPRFLASHLGVAAESPARAERSIVLEGGSIDVSGSGLLLTTEECLLSTEQERNPGFAREDYEQVFAEFLGIRETIWLNRGIIGDDTHGHVDDIARFTDPLTVVAAVERDPADPNYAPLAENLERLRSFRTAAGEVLRVVELTMPEPVLFDGQILPASYANFYITNRAVLVPTFTDPADRIALGTLASLFPGRDVIGVPCRDLVLGLGTLHCMTQQLPLAVV